MHYLKALDGSKANIIMALCALAWPFFFFSIKHWTLYLSVSIITHSYLFEEHHCVGFCFILLENLRTRCYSKLRDSQIERHILERLGCLALQILI